MTAMSVLALVAMFALGSMTYVYRFRGTARYAGVSEYLRKSWPLFAPLNCLLYLSTRPSARRPILDAAELPELAPLAAHWQTIRDEGLALHRAAALEAASSAGSPGYYDLGFRTFYRSGWRKFYLRWYGHTHASARRLCPQTVRLLESIPQVHGAMFALLPPGAELTRHADPVACSLRYHLGLSTPNSPRCFINVDGTDYSWRDGEVLVFDETYLHYARNDTDTERLILLCDVERPTSFFGRLVNVFYRGLMSLTLVPNTAEDRRGFVNRAFATVAPISGRVRRLKEGHLLLYRVIKYSVNFSLIALFAAGIVGLVAAIDFLLSASLH